MLSFALALLAYPNTLEPGSLNDIASAKDLAERVTHQVEHVTGRRVTKSESEHLISRAKDIWSNPALFAQVHSAQSTGMVHEQFMCSWFGIGCAPAPAPAPAPTPTPGPAPTPTPTFSPPPPSPSPPPFGFPSPPPAAVMVTRKNIMSLTTTEQSRFAAAFQRMFQGGGTGPFARMAGLHGYPTYSCVHGAENFPHWHRVYVNEFETLLQQAHFELYGTRNIGLPYWAWDSSQATALPPTVAAAFANIGSRSSIQAVMGSRPSSRESSARSMYDNGYTLLDAGSISRHSSFQSAVSNTNDFLGRVRTMSHQTASSLLESPHGGIHVACAAPMSSIGTAGWHPYFWLHHCNVDRLWEAFLAGREAADGSRGPVEAQFRTSNPTVYNRGLSPFTQPNGFAYTSTHTFTTTAFNYVYDTLPAAQAVPCADSTNTGFTVSGGPATCAQLAGYCNHATHGPGVQRVCRRTCGVCTSSANVREEQIAQSTETVITFGKGSGCKLDLTQPTFVVHFFLVPTGTAWVPPAHTDELGPATAYYSGDGPFFGDAKGDTMHDPIFVRHIAHVAGNLSDFEVMALYDEGEWGGALLPSPTFLHTTAECGGAAPVPDASWFSFSSID